MDGITLPPDLEQFATEAVAAGRYRNVDDLVRRGVELLRHCEQAQREELLASVLAAQAQGDRDGFLTLDEVMRDTDALIEEMAGQHR